MYRDNSLIPTEAIRLAALGALAGGDRPRAEVAREVRRFAERIVGPSLDLLGPSIELLRLEGLVEDAPGAGAGAGPEAAGDARLRLTAAGLEALKAYLRASARPGEGGVARLAVALKLRFLDVLDEAERRDQLAALRDMYEGERARLDDLAGRAEWSGGLLPGWLDLERETVSRRAAWCAALLDGQA